MNRFTHRFKLLVEVESLRVKLPEAGLKRVDEIVTIKSRFHSNRCYSSPSRNKNNGTNPTIDRTPQQLCKIQVDSTSFCQVKRTTIRSAFCFPADLDPSMFLCCIILRWSLILRRWE